MIRAKFRCTSVQTSGENEQVSLMAVYSDDPNDPNKQWSKWTPSGSVMLTINNPDAQGKFKTNEEYFLDFTPAKKD